MKHKIGYNKLNRVAAHRKALIRNMVTVLFKQEKIVTTKAKALRSETRSRKAQYEGERRFRPQSKDCVCQALW